MTTQTSLTELYCQNCQSPHTATNARYRLLAFARWLDSEHHVTDLEAVTVQHVLSYKSALAKSGLAATSQARALETLRSFFRWCHAEGLIDHDPAKLVKSPRAVMNAEPSYLTTDESRKLFDAIGPNGKHAARDRAMTWALSVGLRVGEVVGLNISDVLPPNGNGLAGLRIHGKRSYERIIPLPQPAYIALADYLSTRQDAPKDAPLFVTNYGGQQRRMSRIGFQEWFATLCARADIPKEKQHPHAARHGAAMRWLYQSSTPGGIYTVSRMLGHSSISTTQRYLHVGPQGRAAMESAVMSDPLAT